MSILLDDEQQAIASESRKILEARTSADEQLALLEQDGSYDTRYWETAQEQGWTAITIPESAGGLGLGLIELGQVAAAIGASGAGAPFVTSGFGAADAIARHGNPEQQARWLPALADGSAIGAIAFAQGQSPLPTSPSVIFAGGALTGVKSAVSGGLHADVAIVLASEAGQLVLTLVDMTGVTRTRIESFDNSRCAANLHFDATPATRLTADDARAAALAILARQSIVTAHEQLGGAEAMMLRARDYAITRKAFGQFIGAFQSVKHRIAELYGLVEIARANALHAAANADGPDLVKWAAAARLSATEAYDTAARDCVQVHGGIGVTWAAGIHLHLRRTRTLAIEQGNMIFWEDVLVHELAGDAA